MNRYIDAEKMKEDLASVNPEYKSFVDWCEKMLDCQPTADVHKSVHAKLTTAGQNVAYYWACSECKGEVEYGDSFCRHCGAVLKE